MSCPLDDGVCAARPTVSRRKWASTPSGVGPALDAAGPSARRRCQLRHGQTAASIAPLARVAVVARPLLGQTVCLARLPLESRSHGEWRVAGCAGPSRPGQPGASSSRLTPMPIGGRVPPRWKLGVRRRPGKAVDGRDLTTQPRVWAGFPRLRNTSASSMQSPPASADRHQGQHLVARVRPPSAHCPGPGDGQPVSRRRSGAGPTLTGRSSPCIGHQAAVVEGDLDAVGMVKW